MNLDRYILCVLAEAGHSGLSLKKITTHVYNRVNGLFDTMPMDDVRRSVVNFIVRNTRQPGSIIERTGERGVYRLNESYRDSNQLEFNFKDFDEQPKEEKHTAEDTSLSLF